MQTIKGEAGSPATTNMTDDSAMPKSPHGEKDLAQDDSCPFLDLPCEVRMIVYKWAILQPQTPGTSYEESKQLKAIRGFGFGPYTEAPITQVSKFVRDEALPVFYRLRRFPLVSRPSLTVPGSRRVAPAPLRSNVASARSLVPPGPQADVHLHRWIKAVDEPKIRMMRSFAMELCIPHHRDEDETVRCILCIDMSPSPNKCKMWLGTSWGDNRFMPLDWYWNKVMRRESAGVGPVIERLEEVVRGVSGFLTREDVVKLADAALYG